MVRVGAGCCFRRRVQGLGLGFSYTRRKLRKSRLSEPPTAHRFGMLRGLSHTSQLTTNDFGRAYRWQRKVNPSPNHMAGAWLGFRV